MDKKEQRLLAVIFGGCFIDEDFLELLDGPDDVVSRFVGFEVLEILPLDGNEYALVSDVETSNQAVLKLIANGDRATFRTIEIDEEFERVAAYFKAMLGGEV